VGVDVVRRVARRRRRRVHWGRIATALVMAMVSGSVVAVAAKHYLAASEAAPLPGITPVQAVPFMPNTAPSDLPSPAPPPDRVLLQVPYTTQAPLNNWALHQESCEEATMLMLAAYWHHDTSVVISPRSADAQIAALVQWQQQNWGSEDDLTDNRMGELAKQYYGYAYEIVPSTPQVIREQLAAGRPLIAEVRTHGLGNPNYPGYRSHYEQQGWSVPHFVLIIGYDETGVWLNDPGISKGRGYHVSYAQLSHAIDDLNQHSPALNNGPVLLLAAPELAPPEPPPTSAT
jgi:hypothetical protein